MSANWDQRQQGSYRDLGSLNEYDLIEGVFELPVAELPPTDPVALASWSPVVVIRAHSPYRIRRLFFNSKKSGTPPVLPSPESSGAFQFLEGNLLIPQPTLDSNQTNFVWEGKGCYTYVETCRSIPADGFVLSCSPFTLNIQNYNQSVYQPQPVLYGAISKAGTDAQIGYSQSAQISFADPGYTYTVPTYFPGTFLNSQIANGTAPAFLSNPQTPPTVPPPVQQ